MRNVCQVYSPPHYQTKRLHINWFKSILKGQIVSYRFYMQRNSKSSSTTSTTAATRPILRTASSSSTLCLPLANG